MQNELQQILSNIYEPLGGKVFILDPRHDGIHLEAIIVSPTFIGLSLIQQHRDVYNHIEHAFNSNALHALGLKTYTPEKWKKQSENLL